MPPIATAGRFVKPEMVVTHFHLKEGDKVADFGAGSGFFLKVVSDKIGPNGRLFACEIQKQLVDKIGDVARSGGMQNVDPLWCDLEEPGGIRISDGTLDVGLLINTLFQIEDKGSMVEEIKRTIRTGGVVHVVDWTESFAGLGPHPDQVFTSEDAKTLFESHGFVYERFFDAGDHHYGVSFRRL